jgi:hypothetical protein
MKTLPSVNQTSPQPVLGRVFNWMPQKLHHQALSKDEHLTAQPGSLESLAVSAQIRNRANCVLTKPQYIQEKWFVERHRQAKQSFNVAVGLTGAVGVLGIAVAISVCTGNLPAATATTVMGITSGVASKRLFKLSSEANERFDEIARELLNK